MRWLIFGVFLFSSYLFAQVNTVVSIIPQKYFLEAIGGENVKVSIMVEPGQSPHNYEPKPAQMRELSNAQLYFTIGIEFEKAWLPKFKDQNKNLKIVDSSKGIERIAMQKHHHHDHEHDKLDSHVWLSTKNAKIIAKNMLDALVKEDSANKELYEKNYEALIKHIDEVDAKIRDILSSLPPKTKFMVFHPAFGYFAKDYGLIQLAIEAQGKEPKPQELKKLIDEARAAKVSGVIISPEFSKSAAETIAKELNIQVKSISPLNPKWDENLIELAKIIANQK